MARAGGAAGGAARGSAASAAGVWSTLARVFDGQPAWRAWLVGSATLAALATLAAPPAARWLLDAALSLDGKAAWRGFFWLAGAGLALGMASGARFFLMERLGARAAIALRERFFVARLLASQRGAQDGVADAASQLGQDFAGVHERLPQAMSALTRNLVMGVGAMAMLVIADAALALWVCLGAALLFAPLIVLGRATRRLARLAGAGAREAQSVAAEALGALNAVAMAMGEGEEHRRYRQALLAGDARARAYARQRAVLTAAAIALAAAGAGLALWAAASALAQGGAAPGAITQFVLYAALLAGAIAGAGENWGAAVRETALVSDALDASASTAEAPADWPRRALVSGTLVSPALVSKALVSIRLEEVSFVVPADGTYALSAVSCVLPAGALVAVVGASGAGKTSLLRVLSGASAPTQGRVLFDDRDSAAMAPASLRAMVLATLQGDDLFPSRGGLANIMYGAPAVDDETSLKTNPETSLETSLRARALAGRLGLGEDLLLRAEAVGEAGQGWSGGERQRALVARAVLSGAPVLALDEPTAGLDAKAEAMVLDTLAAETAGGAVSAAAGASAGKRTIVLTTHRPAAAARADCVLLLDAGRLIAQGTHATLMRDEPLYARALKTAS